MLLRDLSVMFGIDARIGPRVIPGVQEAAATVGR